MDSFLKIYLFFFVILFIVFVFIVPSVRVYRQIGINPFRFMTNHDKIHDYAGATMKLFIVMLLFVVMIYSFFDSIYHYLAPFYYLENRVLKITGLVLGHLALLCIVIAQSQMKQSWRIGIDYDNKTRLVTIGFFKFSRNPVYLFLLVALVGLFLILPNAITFTILFSAYLILQISIRLEEEHLEKQHGEVYVKYKKRVRRLI